MSTDRSMIREIKKLVSSDYPGMLAYAENSKRSIDSGNLVEDEDGKLYLPITGKDGTRRAYNYLVSYIGKDTLLAIIRHEVAKLGPVTSLNISCHEKSCILSLAARDGSLVPNSVPSKQMYYLIAHYGKFGENPTLATEGRTLAELCLNSVIQAREIAKAAEEIKERLTFNTSKAIHDALISLHANHGIPMSYVVPRKTSDTEVITVECCCYNTFEDPEFCLPIEATDVVIVKECMKSDPEHWNVLYVVRKIGVAPNQEFIQKLRRKIESSVGDYTNKYRATLVECLNAKSLDQLILDGIKKTDITE